MGRPTPMVSLVSPPVLPHSLYLFIYNLPTHHQCPPSPPYFWSPGLNHTSLGTASHTTHLPHQNYYFLRVLISISIRKPTHGCIYSGRVCYTATAVAAASSSTKTYKSHSHRNNNSATLNKASSSTTTTPPPNFLANGFFLSNSNGLGLLGVDNDIIFTCFSA